MFGYYLNLALRSFRRNSVLTTLMVLTLAVGIGATMTTLALYVVLSGDPIPDKSDVLFLPRIESRPAGGNDNSGDEPPNLLTRHDAEELLRQARGKRQALIASGRATVIPAGGAAGRPFEANALYTSADFIPMFDAPLHSGRAWTPAEDAARARVAVIGPELARTLFGDDDPIGAEVRLPQGSLEVIGVLDDWPLNPRFYNTGRTDGHFGGMEQLLMPFSTSRELGLGAGGGSICWGQAPPEEEEGNLAVNAPCAWLHLWVELEHPGQADEYAAYLTAYSEQQRAAGRFERPANVRLDDVTGWLDHNRIVPNDVRLQVWLAFGFLLVCLVNTVGLLLAKFLRRSGEIGVRRALGASRSAILSQCMAEAGLIGLAGGLVGTGMAAAGMWVIRQQPDDYAQFAQMDGSVFAFTVIAAIVASLLAGALPAWRAMQVTPALQLKSQ